MWIRSQGKLTLQNEEYRERIEYLYNAIINDYSAEEKEND